LEFAVIGTQEAGATRVGDLLRDHPDLWLSDVEELPAFSHTHFYRQGLERTLRRQRTPSDARRLRGTVSPHYMRGWHDTTTATIAGRMAGALPGIKLVALLRDPIERARCQHQTERARGREARSFNEAARQLLTADGLSEGRFLPDETNTYIAQGEYGRILGEYLRYFPRASLQVELTSALDGAPLEVVRRLLRFLGVSSSIAGRPGPAGQNPPSAAEPIDYDLRDMLAAHYAADAEILRAITGLEVPWRAPNQEPPRRPVAVYTAIAGGKDTLEDPEVVSAACDYICFTDDPYLRSDVWQLRPLELLDDDPARRARRAKLLAHRYLPEYGASVWVDANLTLRGDPAHFVRRHLAVQPIAIGEHHGQDQPLPVAGVIACRHGGPADALKEGWWAEARGGSGRDLPAGTSGNGGSPLTRWRPHAANQRAARIRQEIEDADTVVLSPPKAGRSWVCYFLARYVAERAGAPFGLGLLADGREIPPVSFVHEHWDVFESAPAPARLLNEELLVQRRIVVLVRDPRDSLVSYWHHKRVREGRPVPARLELFADCPVHGIERISQATAILLDLCDTHPGDKLLVTYEDLVSEPAGRLREVLRFSLDGRPLDEQSFRTALEASRFESMRDWERRLSPEDARTRYDSRFGRRREGAVENAHFKVRRGEVGAFETEMSPELHRHVTRLPHTAALLKRLGPPRPSSIVST
jgi:hypothetical protein